MSDHTIVFQLDEFPDGLNHAVLDDEFRAASFSAAFRGLVYVRASRDEPPEVTVHFTSPINSQDRRTAADLVAAHSGGAQRARRVVPTELRTCTVATLPRAAGGGTLLVEDESGGAVLAFSDGTNWRRSTDRAIVS